VETPEQYNEVRLASFLDGDSVDVAVLELLFPPAWTAPRHFHNSDLFIYVLEGEFEVTLDGAESVTYGAGEALEMRTEAQMTARNVSGDQPLKLVVFQVGQTQAPFAVPVPDSVP
jgi:quercetin dioxygenase-like cupin family protein